MTGNDREAELRSRTIADFGDQWTRYTENEGYYGSVALLGDILGPLLPLSELAGKRIAEIGSGTGRVVRMLLGAGAASVLAIEPSRAIEVLKRNLESEAHRVQILNARGDEIPGGLGLDFVLSIGVLHHIPDPDAVVASAHKALRPGGQIVVWVYGKEGNRIVVAAIEGMRRVTTHLPHSILSAVAWFCTLGLDIYVPACRKFPFLPMSDYILNVVGNFDRNQRYLTFYDQLRPAYTKYYTEQEVRGLLERGGFTEVALHQRHGYSWTAIGRRPA